MRAQLSSEYQLRLLQLQDEVRALEQRLEAADSAREAAQQQARDLQAAVAAAGSKAGVARGEDVELALEAQRKRFEAELTRRTRATQTAQQKQRAAEMELDRLRIGLHEV